MGPSIFSTHSISAKTLRTKQHSTLTRQNEILLHITKLQFELQSATCWPGPQTPPTRSASVCSLLCATEAAQLYSCCILNHRGGGSPRKPLPLCFEQTPPSRPRHKKQRKDLTTLMTLCTYGWRRFKGYHKVQMYII